MILGANAFKEKIGTKIAAHEFKAEYLENPAKSLNGGETISIDILLKENDILNFGDISLKIIHTLEHTKGSCYFIICESENVMLAATRCSKAASDVLIYTVGIVIFWLNRCGN